MAEIDAVYEDNPQAAKKLPKRQIILVVILVISIICFCCALLMDGGAASPTNTDTGESIQIGTTGNEQGAKLLAPTTIYFTISEMQVAGTHIERAVTLKEDSSKWRNSPSYIFVGEKVVSTVELPAEDEDSDDEATESTLVETSDGSAIVELLTTARIFNSDYFETDSGFLDSCQCIQAGNYIIIIGNARYYEMAGVFEKAVNSGTVFSLDDLMLRLDHLSILE